MAWNGSDGAKGESVKGKGQQRKEKVSSVTPLPSSLVHSFRRGIVAGLVVVIGGAIAAYMMLGRRGAPAPAGDMPAKPAKIAEVEPQIATNVPARAVDEAHKGMVKVRGKWYPEYDKHGGKIWVTKHWIKYHSPKVHTNCVNTSSQSIERKTFSNRADRDIAVLVNTPPGAFRIGGPQQFGRRFEQDFLESLKTPIVVSSEDDERTAALKRAVNAAKIELKQRYDAGEDIVAVMNEESKKLNELGLYREELRREASKAARGAKGDAEAESLVYEAANKMLAERGLAPLRTPVMLKHRMELQKNQKKGKQ